MKQKNDTVAQLIYDTPVSLLRPSPGLVLIILGVFTIYFLAVQGGRVEPMVAYLTIGFAFVISLAGIWLLFRSATSIPLNRKRRWQSARPMSKKL